MAFTLAQRNEVSPGAECYSSYISRVYSWLLFRAVVIPFLSLRFPMPHVPSTAI
jgi:hypothetical protein